MCRSLIIAVLVFFVGQQSASAGDWDGFYVGAALGVVPQTRTHRFQSSTLLATLTAAMMRRQPAKTPQVAAVQTMVLVQM
jgi:hypothetical protein